MEKVATSRWMLGYITDQHQTHSCEGRDEHVRRSVNVAPVTKKIAEHSLTWYGHIKRRDGWNVLRVKLDTPVHVPLERERKTEHQVERLGKMRCGKYGLEGGVRIEQDEVEEL